MLKGAVDLLRAPLQADGVAAFRRSDDGAALEVVAAAGVDPKLVGTRLVDVGQGTVTDVALDHDGPVIINDVDADHPYLPSPLSQTHAFRCSVSVGLAIDGRSWGVCEFHWRQCEQVSEGVSELVASVVGLLTKGLERIERERQHAWVVESVGEAIIVADPNRTIRTVNPGLCELTGRRQDELVGRPYDELFLDACAPVLQELEAELERDRQGRMRLLMHRGGGGVAVTEVYARRVDHRVMFVVDDITEMTRTEHEYRKFYLMVEHARDMIGLSDLEGHVTYLNPAGYAMVGLSPAQLAGLSADDFVAEHERERFFNDILPQVVDAGIWDGAIDIRDFGAGTVRQTQATIVALTDPETDAPVGYATVLRDVSERVRLRDQLRQSQKMEALGLLASGVAHDFNNHLTVIKGYSELLLTSMPDDDPRRAQLEKVEQVSVKAQRLADQLLTFSRRKVRQPRVLDLNEVLTGLHDMLRRLIGEHIALDLQVGDQPEYVEIDPSDIEQAVLNLAVNARDAIETTGTITIRVRPPWNVEMVELDHLAQLGEHPVVLEVRDTGQGIPAEMIEHLFEPFFTTKDPNQGTGLGLATVRRIVADAGGEVRVTSRPGWGSCFKLFFPRAQRLPEQGGEAALDEARLEGDEVILVVEDNLDVLGYITDVLRQHGYDAMGCADGHTAVELLELYHDSIDAVISDVVLPRLSASELREKLVSRYPDIPIVLTSGYSDYEQFQADEDLRDLPFVAKPMTATELLGQLRRVLDQRG